MSKISQMDLVAEILKFLGQQGVEGILPRQMNVICESSTAIVTEFERPVKPSNPNMGLGAWLASDDTGSSSLYLAGMLSGNWPLVKAHTRQTRLYAERPHPLDPDDFGRCYRLLRAVPEFQEQLAKLDGGPVWRVLINHWPELEHMFEVKNPQMYLRMRELIESVKQP